MGLLEKIFGKRVDLREILDKGAIIIDVRSEAEFSGGHVKGATNIPLGNIKGEAHNIKSLNKPIILCCASGMRSGIATGTLKKAGIEAYNGGSWHNVNRHL